MKEQDTYEATHAMSSEHVGLDREQPDVTEGKRSASCEVLACAEVALDVRQPNTSRPSGVVNRALLPRKKNNGTNILCIVYNIGT